MHLLLVLLHVSSWFRVWLESLLLHSSRAQRVSVASFACLLFHLLLNSAWKEMAGGGQTSSVFTPWALEPCERRGSSQTHANHMVSSDLTAHVEFWQEPVLTRQLADSLLQLQSMTEVGGLHPSCHIPGSATARKVPGNGWHLHR